MSLEGPYQRKLIAKLEKKFPGIVIMKNDPSYIQGIPDLTLIHKDKWATLEVKKSANASHEPNQDYYVDKMNGMSYSTFIYPENEKDVLNDLQRLFEAH